MKPRTLYIPYLLTDLDAARRYYVEHLGLTPVEEWDRDGERGVVLRVADGAFVELVAPGRPRPAPIAFELGSAAEVDRSFADWSPEDTELIEPPHRYPRGHYGFEVHGPGGAHVMVWSER